MELTAQTLREVEFREKLRGYHPDDVDDFLEEAAVALEDLLQRLNQAESRSGPTPMPAPDAATGAVVVRADRAPQEAPPAPPPVAAAAASSAAASAAPSVAAAPSSGISEETLHRTLLLAQQTADAAIADAQEAAQRMRDEAQAEARRITEEAQARATEVRTHAEAQAAQALSELEAQRAGLEHEVVALRSWAMQQRDRLREGLTEQVRSLDVWLSNSAPPTGAIGPAPATSPAELAPAPDERGELASAPGSPEELAPAPGPPENPTAEASSPAEDVRPMPFGAAGRGPTGGLVDHQAVPDWLSDGTEAEDQGNALGVPAEERQAPSGGLFRPH